MLSLNSDKQAIKRTSLFNNTQVKSNQENLNENILKEKEIKDNDEQINRRIKNIISINITELKELIQKEYIQFQHRIDNTIDSYSKKINYISDCENRLMEQIIEIKIKVEKIDFYSEKIAKIDDKLTTLEIRLNNFLKDFRDAINKYDDIFLDNMVVPGKIGKFCKYKNIKDFLSFAIDKFNNIDFITGNEMVKMKNNQEKLEKFIQKINFEMDLLREDNFKVTNKKICFMEEKINDEIQNINNKINAILYSDLGNKLQNLTDDYNNVKNNLYDRLNIVEEYIQILRRNKSPKNRTIHNKKDSKVSFSNLSNFNANNKEEKSNLKNDKSPHSSKDIHKYNSIKVKKSPYHKKNKKYTKSTNKKSQSPNLDYIDEYIDENNDKNDNNDGNPINDMVIKSLNFSTRKIKNKNSDKSLNTNTNNINEKKSNKTIAFRSSSLNDFESVNSHYLNENDSSYNEEKKDNIEEFIVENKDKTDKNNQNENLQLKEQNKDNIANKNINNDNKSKIKSSLRLEKLEKYQDTKKENKNSVGVKDKLKFDKNLTKEYDKENDKNIFNIKNTEKKNKSTENKIKTKKVLYLNKRDLIVAKTHSVTNNNTLRNKNRKKTKIKNNINIKKNIIDNNINKKNKDNNNINIIIKNDNHICNKINNINSNIIEINNKKEIIQKSKNNNINGIRNNINKNPNEKKSKIISKNKSFENHQINNNLPTSISLGNITDISFINTIQFTNHEINKRNKEIPFKNAYYTLFQLESLKKDGIKSNIKPVLFKPKEIPLIINNSVHSHSYSNKIPKRHRPLIYLKDRKIINEKNIKKNNDLELKIIPTNFKESKKIQINLKDY